METVKRSKAIKIVSIVFVFIYVILLILGAFDIVPIVDIWFSVFLFLLGAIMLLKGICFWRDSAFLFGFSCLFCATGSILTKYLYLYIQPVCFYFMLICLAILAVFVIFRQNIHLKMFAIVFVEVLLLFTKQVTEANNTIFWVLQSIYLIFVLILFIIFLFVTKESNRGI